MENSVYPLMLHHEYEAEELLGSCFGYKKNSTFVTAAHCLPCDDRLADLYVGIEAEVLKQSPMPDVRTVRNALSVYRHEEYDIAVIQVQDEYDQSPLVEPYFHNILSVDNFGDMAITYRGYTDDRMGDNGIVARTKPGAITLDYRKLGAKSRPVFEFSGHVEHNNSGGPVLLNDSNTGTPIGIVVTLKGTSGVAREDSTGEALFLYPFKEVINSISISQFNASTPGWKKIY